MNTVPKARFDEVIQSALTACVLRQTANGGWELVGPAAPNNEPAVGRRPTRARMEAAQLRLQTHFAVNQLLPERREEYANHPCRAALGRLIKALTRPHTPELRHLVWLQLTTLGVIIEGYHDGD